MKISRHCVGSRRFVSALLLGVVAWAEPGCSSRSVGLDNTNSGGDAGTGTNPETISETGSGSEKDLEEMVQRLLPRDVPYHHSHGSFGHGADYILPALISPSLTIPVEGGNPALGQWQSLVLVDFNSDNPRRRVRLSFLAG